MLHLSNQEARRFLLTHQGLLGSPRFQGKAGILAYIRQAGCIQFDPVSVCGRSPELALLSRVPGYREEMLYELLYQDRLLVDHFDKNLAIYPVDDWPCFARERARYGHYGKSRGQGEEIRAEIIEKIRRDGPQSAASLEMSKNVHWFWGKSSLARAALEQLYYGGELCISSKQGVLKTYDLPENCIPKRLLDAKDPFPEDPDHLAWRVLRRVRAVGFLWNKASDAWLGIPDFSAAVRNSVFDRLTQQEKIMPLKVEGIRETMYLSKEDLPLLQKTMEESESDEPARCRLLAPLDCLLWDRKLIAALFGFNYRWEIYTPPEKRRYGAYVLPILYEDRFVGRIEPAADRKSGLLAIRGLWWEEGIQPDRQMKAALKKALRELADYHGLAPEK